MKCVSFNVNSIRTRLHQLQAVIEKHNPDIIGLQETKVSDEDFPIDAITSLGYHVEFFGQKTHYGVALLSKKPLLKVSKGFPQDKSDAQRRFISAECQLSNGQTITILNGYFPQGENRNHPIKFPNKQKYYADLLAHIAAHYSASAPIIVMGDMNVAPDDSDIGIGEQNRKRWLREGKCSFLPEERDWLQHLLDWGMQDTYRVMQPNAADRFSWFDYRSPGFEYEPSVLI